MATTPKVSFSPSHYVPEGQVFIFALKRTYDTTKRVSVDWSLSGSASASDFVGAISGKVTFEPGETMRFIVLQSKADNLAELDESFTVQISNPVGCTLGTSSISGYLVNIASAPVPPIPIPTPLAGVMNFSLAPQSGLVAPI